MGLTADRNKIIEAAKELGLKVTFDSTNPGISFQDSNEHLSWDQVAEEIFDFLGELKDI